MKKADGAYFKRFGVIRSFRQDLKDIEKKDFRRVFHIAPKKYGFYAFPDGLIEPYLIINTEPFHSSQKSVWIKDENGKKISFENPEEYLWRTAKNLSQERKKLIRSKKIKLKTVSHIKDGGNTGEYFLTAFRHPRKFRHRGYVWSHLHTLDGFPKELENKGVVIRSWIMLGWEDYSYALQKTVSALKERIWKSGSKDVKFDFHIFRFFLKREWRHWCSLDDFEVFIEKWKP
ncbi:MAG TPA: hypothetical protein PK683_20960 [Leptospiraceae bacterium]|nr:hypothetical protein [Leptospiraceae bacterium]HNH10980.1 hypothetical protein [Leptospiraceae bacterium]